MMGDEGACEQHIGLVVEGDRFGRTQPVAVRALQGALYKVLLTPGFVEGIAAGDVIRLTDAGRGTFEVVRRGGNLAIKVMSRPSIASLLPDMDAALSAFGGRRDGAIEEAAVYTVPFPGGFEALEAAINSVVTRDPNAGWYYGNVHAEDGVTLLRWWEQP